MATATITVYEAAMKQAWTQETLEKQFYAEDPLLENIQKRTPEATLGLEALTPVWTGRGGGYTAVPSTGAATLNAASAQQVNRAKWLYKRHWKPIKIDTAAIKQTEGKAEAVASAVETEVSGNVSDVRKQITRQLFLDQTALIAKCGTTTASTTVVLKAPTVTDPYAMGYQAIRNGWLVPGQQIDLGTTANQVSVAEKRTIESVEESETEPKLVISGATVTTSETTFVSIASARSGTTSNENNGFRNMISETANVAFGNLKPENVPGWKGVVVKAEGKGISREKVLELRRKIRQKGETPDWAFTSLKQLEALENQLYPQVRFQNPAEVNTGNGESLMIGTIKVQGHQDCPDEDFNLVKSDKIGCLRSDQPTWVTQAYGNNGGAILTWDLNGTFMVSALEYFFELVTNRRNALGAIRELA